MEASYLLELANQEAGNYLFPEMRQTYLDMNENMFTVGYAISLFTIVCGAFMDEEYLGQEIA